MRNDIIFQLLPNVIKEHKLKIFEKNPQGPKIDKNEVSSMLHNDEHPEDCRRVCS